MHNAFMKRAMLCAKKAADKGEIPVGCVIVKDNKIIATGYNVRESKRNALCHAEIIAINRACKKLGGWRLHQCDMYVTLEPCPMCAGAIINSRIKNVYVGTEDPKAGCFGSLCDFNSFGFNHRPNVEFGILREDCSRQIKDFFKKLRNK